MRRFIPVVLLLAAPLAFAELSPGEEISPAAFIDLTTDGLDAAGEIVPALLPSTFDVPDIETDEIDRNWYGDYGYYYSVTNVWIGIGIDDVNIEPGSGVLNLTADGEVWANTSSDQGNVYLEACVVGCFDAADCGLYVDPFPVDISTSIALEVVDDGTTDPYLDATVGSIYLTLDWSNDDVHLDCWIGTVDEILDYIGLSPVDYVLGMAEDMVADELDSLRADLEATIEDAFSSAFISEELDLNGVPLTLELAPSDIEITSEGLRLTTKGSASAPMHDCIAEYGITGSLETTTADPSITDIPAALTFDPHAGLLLSDEFLNQLTFAAWYGGVLCYEVDESVMPISLDTTLLTLMSDEIYGDLFPEAVPMQIITRPAKPPTIDPAGTHDVEIEIEELGIDFYGELDDRMVLVLGVDLATDVGVDLDFDDSTGALNAAIDFDTSAIDTTVRHNEFAPGEDDTLSAAFGNLLDAVVGPLIGDMLGGFSFDLPAFSGMGLTGLETEPAGAGEDWLGVYATLGEVTYGSDSSGCLGDGGDSGCDSGCSAGAGPGMAFWFFPLLLGALRRREK